MNNLKKNAISILKLVSESIDFALSQLKIDKFRTFLSLLGVCIGIFSIVAVFTVVDSLQNSIREGFDSFGSELVFVDQYPMGPEEGDGGVFKWWEYRKRPRISYSDYLYLKNNCSTYDRITFSCQFTRTVKFEGNSFESGRVIGATTDWEMMVMDEIEKGRSFTASELQKGTHVAIIGNEVAEKLFSGGNNPIGKTIKVGATDAIVIGVFKSARGTTVSMVDTDAAIVIPLVVARTLININQISAEIIINPKEGVNTDDFIGELKSLMRKDRRLKPVQKDNFSINQMSFAIKEVGKIFRLVNMIGWIIGGFSLLIGGFGIANIMFVSVKERTKQIGIQKALGAKKYVITMQFLIESATLAIAGGIVGILLVYIGTLFIPAGSLEIRLTIGNVIMGLLIATVIGVISGVVPARVAANLNPVDAINE
ncbi:MAG: ABC transporter permease [Bacteroidales bacterium]|nr:ABC transporter permease [Bacteroidales bacterium]MDD4670601.1 ABC transporter permease [Bacteroidales bacterium]